MHPLHRLFSAARCVVIVALVGCSDPTGSFDPDATLLLASGGDIDVIRPDGTGRRRLIADMAADDDPDWSPDGKEIVFARAQDSIPGAPSKLPDIFRMNADGSALQRLTGGPMNARHPRWSRDGQRILFSRPGDTGYIRVYRMTRDGADLQPITSAAYDNFDPSWSPDGTQILYLSNRAPRNWSTMYIANADGTGERLLGGDVACRHNVGEARWSPDGTRVAYDCDGIYAIGVNGGDPVRLSPVASPHRYTYDFGPVWAPDGDRIAYSRSYVPDGPEVPTLPPVFRYEVHIVSSDGTTTRRLTNDPAFTYVSAWGSAR